jgi:hypothetical protein
LPGAQYSLSQSGEAAMDQHSACSRPPEPTTRILMVGRFSCDLLMRRLALRQAQDEAVYFSLLTLSLSKGEG